MPALSYCLHTAPASGLHKTSVLVTGEREALLIDGQLTLAEQHRVLAAVLDSGKRLTTVFVSAADPDCWFGLQAVRQAFPGVTVVATAATVERIKDTGEARLATWRNLGRNLPTELVIPDVLTSGVLEFEGRVFEVRGGDPELVWRTQYLWQPEDRALLGGALLYAGVHPWTADTATPAERAAWDRALAGARRLAPRLVVPGHRTPDTPTDASAITFTRDYLAAFETAAARAANGEALRDAVLAFRPGLAGTLALELGARAATGEIAWS
ncbi:MBL fold metallo-hydrolase [Streptomyces specialis]|uniref:MBL fold metallo-hydrolase n=1 Tax=Streptomyces specialis TaxID=498367 RepID=UPI00073E5BF8|nr:MBL fold metallo-hydrolase [Streptomyces specialis]